MKIYTENFTIVLNKHITNKEIDTYEFRVMCYLLMLSDNDGTCYPSYKTIADRIDISETKAKDSIKKLIDLGLIKKEKRKKSDGSATSNLYVVCEKTTVKVDEVAEETTPCSKLYVCTVEALQFRLDYLNRYWELKENTPGVPRYLKLKDEYYELEKKGNFRIIKGWFTREEIEGCLK